MLRFPSVTTFARSFTRFPENEILKMTKTKFVCQIRREGFGSSSCTKKNCAKKVFLPSLFVSNQERRFRMTVTTFPVFVKRTPWISYEPPVYIRLKKHIHIRILSISSVCCCIRICVFVKHTPWISCKLPTTTLSCTIYFHVNR